MTGLLNKTVNIHVHGILVVYIQVKPEAVSGQQGHSPAFLQNSLGTRVSETSVAFSLRVSVASTWRQVVRGRRRAEEVLAGAGAGLVADRLHLDADSGHGLARRRVGRRVPGVEARLGVGRWGGAGDLQVQSDAEKQWWNYLLVHQPPLSQFKLLRLS